MIDRPTVRPYEPTDHQAVRSLFIRVNRELAPPLLRAQFESHIASSLEHEIDRIPDYYDSRRGSGFWVAILHGMFVGNFGLEPAEKDAFELRRMYVDPDARRLGVARLLLAHAEKICRVLGRPRMVLSTSELQAAALGLYRAAGYRLVCEEVAMAASNKTIGGGVRRFHFEKTLSGA